MSAIQTGGAARDARSRDASLRSSTGRERGILFSAPMVRALLAGTKTQTRRMMNPQPWFDPRYGTAVGKNGGWIYGSLNERRDSPTYGGPGDRWHLAFDEDHQLRACTVEAYGWGARAGCPYGVVGDRLWLREAWHADADSDGVVPFQLAHDDTIIYAADGTHRGEPAAPGRKRPGIHMPRWASRITLEVTEVRVQRVNDISDEDAKAEGMVFHDGHGTGHTGWRHDVNYGFVEGTPRGAFFALWRLINGDDSLKANPWCWAVSFRRLTP